MIISYCVVEENSVLREKNINKFSLFTLQKEAIFYSVGNLNIKLFYKGFCVLIEHVLIVY